MRNTTVSLSDESVSRFLRLLILKALGGFLDKMVCSLSGNPSYNNIYIESDPPPIDQIQLIHHHTAPRSSHTSKS